MKNSDYIKFYTPFSVEQSGCQYFNRLRKKSPGGHMSGNPAVRLVYNRVAWFNKCV
jgi:hypothetical protein